jgi:1-acyl-sn-glycerol-3-phosphate acyltransferase
MTKAAGRGVREYFWFYFALLYFGVVGVLCTFISSVLYLLLPRSVGARLGKHTIGAVFRSFLWLLQTTGITRLDLSALDGLRGEAGLIIAPNHPCLLDAVLVIARVPDVCCIMKAKIQDNIVLGGGARLAGYIRNDCGLNMVRAAVAEVRNGRPLLVFPEGTRTRRPPINSFKGGFALVAKRTQATIQTVFIETNSAFLSKGWPLLKKPAFPLVYRARLGRRFIVQGDVTVSLRELEQYYRQELGDQPVVRASQVLHPSGSPHPGRAA